MIRMPIVGLWHGANCTFFLLGARHGALLMIYHVKRSGKVTVPS
jgi:D-alanyl-lipoteichoic acid acyltransferase DltB (MBOAT superfamily)